MANLDDKTSLSEVTNRIFRIISNLSETNRLKALRYLEKLQQTQLSEKREYERKHFSIYAVCSAGNFSFKDFIRNISLGGLFIETKTPLDVNVELSIRFLHSDVVPLIKASGEIVWVDIKGAGVKFYKPLPKDFFGTNHVIYL
jgi:hypothetical protein